VQLWCRKWERTRGSDVEGVRKDPPTLSPALLGDMPTRQLDSLPVNCEEIDRGVSARTGDERARDRLGDRVDRCSEDDLAGDRGLIPRSGANIPRDRPSRCDSGMDRGEPQRLDEGRAVERREGGGQRARRGTAQDRRSPCTSGWRGHWRRPGVGIRSLGRRGSGRAWGGHRRARRPPRTRLCAWNPKCRRGRPHLRRTCPPCPARAPRPPRRRALPELREPARSRRTPRNRTAKGMARHNRAPFIEHRSRGRLA
jgi:hypothetical protein